MRAGSMYSGSQVASASRTGSRRKRLARLDVADQLRAADGAANKNESPLDIGNPHHRGLDFPELDAEAADLDLLVHSAGKVQLAVAPTGEIPGAVEPSGGAVAETLHGELWAVQVAERQARPADVDLAG